MVSRLETFQQLSEKLGDPVKRHKMTKPELLFLEMELRDAGERYCADGLIASADLCVELLALQGVRLRQLRKHRRGKDGIY